MTNEKQLSFKQYLVTNTTVEKESSDLFIGRFQPFHKGHATIVESMNNPIVVIVTGKASSTDKYRNPLSPQQQQSLIHQVFPNVPVFISEVSGFVPAIIKMVNESGYNVRRVFAGDDRVDEYRGQVHRANKKILEGDNTHQTINVEFVETPRIVSATDVREFIRTNNLIKYIRSMPRALATTETFLELKSVMC